jgi:hypothetical protein
MALNKECVVDVSCVCTDQRHVVSFCVDATESVGDPVLWIYPNLNNYLGFFERLVIAFKYVFSVKSERYPYDTVHVSLEDAKKISKLLNTYACLIILRRAKAARQRKRELNANKGSKALSEQVPP